MNFLVEECSRAPQVKAALLAFEQNNVLALEAAEGSFREALAILMAKSSRNMGLLVLPTEREAQEAAANIAALGGSAVLFPSWGLAPFHSAAKSSPVFACRSALLSALAFSEKIPPSFSILVISLRAFLSPLIPPDELRAFGFILKAGGKLDTLKIASELTAIGYIRVPKAQMPGEFVLRGEVLDVFCAASGEAFRIQFDFDKIESIRAFDPVEQTYTSEKNLEYLLIPPVKELIWTDERIDLLSKNLESMPEFPDGGAKIIEQLISKREFEGEELFFHLAFKNSVCITDYFLEFKNSWIFFAERERLENAIEPLTREYEAGYRNALRDNGEGRYPSPQRLVLPFAETVKNSLRQVSLMNIKKTVETETQNIINLKSCPPRGFMGNINYLKEVLNELTIDGWNTVIACESEAQTERFRTLLTEFSADNKEFKGRPPQIVYLPVNRGFELPEIKLIVIAECEIFGRNARKTFSNKTVQSRAILSFVELNPGDYVVHINYGIGIFEGIERVKALGNERDYIKLVYADDDTVFVPIEQVNLVQRYIGSEGGAPRLDKLGSKSWELRKERARAAAKELASKLIALYSKRKAARGFAFGRDTEWQLMFESSFEYEETEDQLRCIEEVKADMEKTLPMDRLICGDVGYGKTEIALRAAFKAVMSGKQVAFLAPTTILAEQHFDNFKRRFERFPVRIAMLSRFVDSRITKKNIASIANGEFDIVIGTHRLIQKDVVFKDLGLLVVDEEQRFGVKDKERLKELKLNVDTLALSATPIPRTLHMSLLKIRDMSLLTTPPKNRRPIETHIGEYNSALIASAIRAEVARGGQVYFLHNKIESLRETRIFLEKLVPEMLIETAHGQMESRTLENIMHRFIHGGFHVLVSTTIIENGIDIPNVNTIIIDRADMYGVAQLYQLRGRVGRSEKIAFAYLFYPKNKSISELAMRRLEAVSDYTELGAGFKIAMKDMEIRGAGNLLGREQSGNIYSVGFDMYLHLLDTAIAKLQNENYEAPVETLLELEYSGFLPDSYIGGSQEKMEVYKKISAVQNTEELDAVLREIRERFGPLPDEAKSLLSLAEIRIICKELGVSELRERGGWVRVDFFRVSGIKIENALRLIKESSGKIKLDPNSSKTLIIKTGGVELAEKSLFICETLKKLSD
ncbi:MAG: transcription-repair coupling factor [Spirochaetaceae bacterium]|jgi:transcription-repair coupling factor (superfamily II helicase)|nr:transcription-repair coupling factor [Spirochaetaceae bacterium]